VIEKYSLSNFVLFVAALFSFIPSFAGTDTPGEEIRATVDKVLIILKDPSLTKEDRRRQLREAVYPRFHFQEMTARSLGLHWKGLSPKEREEFEKVFVDLLQDAYAGRIESYHGEAVKYAGETVDGSYAEVKTIVPAANKKPELSVGYKLLRTDGDWKIYDVVIENISLINNYRAQFDRIISRSSFEELLRRMREKQPKLKAKGAMVTPRDMLGP